MDDYELWKLRKTPFDIARCRAATECDWNRLPPLEALLACGYCLDRVLYEEY